MESRQVFGNNIIVQVRCAGQDPLPCDQEPEERGDQEDHHPQLRRDLLRWHWHAPAQRQVQSPSVLLVNSSVADPDPNPDPDPPDPHVFGPPGSSKQK
jgi:hypothetical protein